MIKADREYRSFAIQKRDDEEANKYIVEGYASTFDRYPLLEMDGETYYEQIDRHAFDETDMSDVVFLLDHAGRVYARTKNNSVELSIDEKGLWTRTDLSRTESARQVAEDIEVGNYSQMSFAFIVDEDHFDRKTKTRCIDKVKKVFDISAVGFPANPYTNIGVSMRDYFNGEIELEKAERLAAEKRQRELDKLKLKLRLMEETL